MPCLWKRIETELPSPGTVQKIDSEYVRMGTSSIFMFTEPLGGWRHTETLEHRKMGDFAKMMREISETYYPDVSKSLSSTTRQSMGAG